MNVLLFLFGFFSLWLIPGFYKLNLPYLIFIIIGLYSFWLMVTKNFFKDYFIFLKNYKFYLLLSLIYLFVTIFAAFSHRNPSGIPPAFAVLSVFWLWSFLNFLNTQEAHLKIENYLLGFWFGLLFSALYILLEAYFYYTRYLALTEILFSTSLLKAAGEHTYFNEDYSYFHIFHRPLFRPAGFSWDPGLTLPAYVIFFVLVLENNKKYPFSKIGLFLVFCAIVVSTSKTAIGGLLVYLFAKFGFWIFSFLKNSLREKLEKLSPLFGFLAFFLIGMPFFLLENSHSGLIHIRYLSSLIFLLKANFFELLFGFGYRNTGYFFREYVAWAKDKTDFPVVGFADVESLLTNVFLWGGMLGALFWIFTYTKSYQKASRKERLLLLTIMGLAFGYNFHTLWFLAFYFYFFWSKLTRKQEF